MSGKRRQHGLVVRRPLKNPPTVKAAKAKASKRGAAGGSTKAAMVGQMLLDPKGCTAADVMKACKWPSVSMPQQARLVGLNLIKKKEGKTTRYWGEPQK